MPGGKGARHSTRERAVRMSMRLSARPLPRSPPSPPAGTPPAPFPTCRYAPLSVRLAQWLAQPNLAARDEVLRTLASPPPFAHTQQQDTAEGAGAEAVAAAEQGRAGAVEGGGTSPVTLVFFIGGCTFAEIAAVRWLHRNEQPQRQYIVGTTHICNGDSLIESLTCAVDNQLKRVD